MGGRGRWVRKMWRRLESRRSDRGKDALGSENGERPPMTPQLRDSFTTAAIKAPMAANCLEECL
jgi:hypothetical protein